MKKITKIISVLFAAIVALVSCMGNEEVKTTPECALLSFSIGDITTNFDSKTSAGKDTVVKRVLAGSSVAFNIDQVKGIVTSIDSLPNWVSLEKIVPSFNAQGSVYGRTGNDSLYYPMSSGKDSLDFTKPVDIMVVATDLISTKHYTVSINKTPYERDTLIWNNTKSDCAVSDDFKTLVNGKHVYAFYKNDKGATMMTAASTVNNMTSWTTPVGMEGVEIDYKSVMVFNDNFYALGNDGCIYVAEDNARPNVWKKMGESTFERILASDKYYLYAFDGKEILGSKDAITWTSCGKSDTDMLPTNLCNSLSYTSKTNSNIIISMMNGVCENNDKNCVAWYKVTSLDNHTNQDWMYIQITKDNPYGLPRFKYMTAAVNGSTVYAFGMEVNGSFSRIYRSTDNGISWHLLSSKFPLPANLDSSNGTVQMVSVDNELWIIQKGGNVWSGVIR